MRLNEYSNTEMILSDLDKKSEECFTIDTPPWVRRSYSPSRRWTPVLLAGLCLALLCAIIALGAVYVEKNKMAAALKAQGQYTSPSFLEGELIAENRNTSDLLDAQNRDLCNSLSTVQQELAEKSGLVDSLEADKKRISATLSSVQQELAEKSRVADSLDAQNRKLFSSLSSVQQELAEKSRKADSLEVEKGRISSSLSSVQQELAEKIGTVASLESQNRGISASLSSVQQKLAGTEKKLKELQANHTDLLSKNPSCKGHGGCRPCDSGWRSNLGQCYFFSREKRNWMQSRDYCISQGAQLVIISCQQEQTFVSKSINETHWIGLNDLEVEGQWHWVDNTPLSATGIHFWYQRDNGMHEPDDWTGGGHAHGEDCGAAGDESGTFSRWFDAPCQKQKKFICEK
ncbi:hypothetical protein JZ751_029226 [Albula glossodonta]|uniref:C-type lectin domain-containing protein n=1 Tax=Albula glossodonta TaxID=121402 RepID=A0A8T2P9J0_9TELE|nr:hypothetical protein JZ751_029226 [Albula glossodonta]